MKKNKLIFGLLGLMTVFSTQAADNPAPSLGILGLAAFKKPITPFQNPGMQALMCTPYNPLTHFNRPALLALCAAPTDYQQESTPAVELPELPSANFHEEPAEATATFSRHDSWEKLDSAEISKQIEMLATTQEIFDNALKEEIDHEKLQAWSQKWRSLALATEDGKSYPGFMRGLKQNYSKCHFSEPLPPFNLCLGYESLEALTAAANPSAFSDRVQQAQQHFSVGRNTEVHLKTLRETLIAMYCALAKYGNKAPFTDFNYPDHEARFRAFFDSVENLTAAQQSREFRPLDRMGLVLRQSSVFIQDPYDLELAVAATKSSDEFQKVYQSHCASWQAAGLTSDNMKKISQALEGLRLAETPEAQQTLAQHGLASLSQSEQQRTRLERLATASTALLSNALDQLKRKRF